MPAPSAAPQPRDSDSGRLSPLRSTPSAHAQQIIAADAYAAYEAVSDVIIVTSVDGAMHFLNRAGRDLLSIGDGRSVLDECLFPAHTTAARILLFDEVAPSAVALGQITCDTALQAADGRIFPASQTVIASCSTPGAAPDTLTFIIHDVSVERHAAARLRESQRLFERIVRCSPDLMFLYDPAEKRVVWMSRCVHAFLGGAERDARTLNQRELLRIVHRDDRSGIGQHADRMRSAYGDEILSVDVRMRTSGGRPRWINARSTVFSRRENGAPLLLLGVASDITARKQAEIRLRHDRDEAESGIAFKNRFLLQLSAEFRSTLHGVIGGLTEIERNRDCRLTARELQDIHQTIDRVTDMLETVADIRDLTAIETGSMAVTQDWVQVQECIAATVASFAGHPIAGAVPIQVALPEAPALLFTDGPRLRQALTHIVGIALDASPDQPLQLSLSVRAADGSPETIRLHAAGWRLDYGRAERTSEVRDSAEPSRWSRNSGAGLTVMLARELCEMLGCQFEIDHADGGAGVTFRVELPAPSRSAALARRYPAV